MIRHERAGSPFADVGDLRVPERGGGPRRIRDTLPSTTVRTDMTRQAAPRRPTMVDVAKRAGVSLKTVSRVVNNEPAVAQELVGRVMAAIAELGFRRNDIARNLRSPSVNATVGLLIEEIANPFYAAIAGAAAEVAAAH